MSETAEAITFTVHADRSVTVDDWPSQSEIDLELLAMAMKGQLIGARVRGDRLIMHIANGQAEYRLGEVDEVRQVRMFHLMSAHLKRTAEPT